MRRSVQRWGNSLAVRIPATVAAQCRLTPGTAVDIEVDDGRVVLVPRRPLAKKYDLRRLVAKITPRNRPAVIETGKRVGREAW